MLSYFEDPNLALGFNQNDPEPLRIDWVTESRKFAQ